MCVADIESSINSSVVSVNDHYILFTERVARLVE